MEVYSNPPPLQFCMVCPLPFGVIGVAYWGGRGSLYHYVIIEPLSQLIVPLAGGEVFV